MTDVPSSVVLPCGCVIRPEMVEGVRTLTFVPCRRDCVNFVNAVELARQKKVDVEYRRAP